VWTTEYNFYDALIRSALIAASTERVDIGTGVTYAFSRRPVALAAAAADIQAASRGRFSLGLGMGTKGMRSKWYDIDWDKPARRFGEIVRFLRAAQAAVDGLHFEGEYETVDIPDYSLGASETFPKMEIWGGGVNAAMLTRVARDCDGVATHSLTIAPNYWEATVEAALAEGTREDGSKAKVAAWVLTSVADDEGAARQQARRNVAFYFSTPSYQSVAKGAPWSPAAAAVLAAARELGTQRLDEIAQHVTDDMLDDLSISGTPHQVSRRISEMENILSARGVNEIVFQAASRGSDRQRSVDSCAAIIDCAARNRFDA
jgi:alkanesulfonate monooxygenase SsuD/methylene tetrahydromethanopterin reductase-like flavin-dependent oxidoreductase (luciferase family)